MDLGLRDKVAVVAGGSRGCGLGIAEELAKEGAEFCKGLCQAVAAVRRGVEGCRTDRSHDASLFCLSLAAAGRVKRLFRRLGRLFARFIKRWFQLS